jgi:hypothetical protein
MIAEDLRVLGPEIVQELPHLKVIRIGRRILVSVRELERWIDRNERGLLT